MTFMKSLSIIELTLSMLLPFGFGKVNLFKTDAISVNLRNAWLIVHSPKVF